MSILLSSMCLYNHLQNCLINITFVVDPKSLLNLGVPMGGEKA